MSTRSPPDRRRPHVPRGPSAEGYDDGWMSLQIDDTMKVNARAHGRTMSQGVFACADGISQADVGDSGV